MNWARAIPQPPVPQGIWEAFNVPATLLRIVQSDGRAA